MTYPDLDDARKFHGALREIFHRNAEWPDAQTPRRVDALCREAAAAVNDAYCRQEIRLVAGYAAELFSEGRHRKYESESLSGGEFLRLQILKALDSFHSRLYSLEAIRRAAEIEGARAPGGVPQPPKPSA